MLLAAGYSRRFGSDKRVARLGRQSMLQRTMAQVEQAAAMPDNLLGEKILVLRHGESQTDFPGWQQAYPASTDPARQGLGNSIAGAARWLLAQEQPAQSEHKARQACAGVLILLADMPFIRPQTLCRLAEALSRSDTHQVRAQYQGRPGHPVGFSRSCFSALAQCQGDLGARQLLDQRVLTRVSVDDPGVLQDIDTAEQWNEYNNQASD